MIGKSLGVKDSGFQLKVTLWRNMLNDIKWLWYLIEDHSQILQHQFRIFLYELKDKKKQTYFDKTWLEHDDFLQWVAEVKNEPTKYRCKICHKTNGLSTMWIGAIKIHLKDPSHVANVKRIKNFFRSSTSPTRTHTLAPHCHQPQHQGKIDEIVTNSAVSEAEIWWTSKSIIAWYSNNSNADCIRLFFINVTWLKYL